MIFTDDFVRERYQIDALTRVGGQNRRRVVHRGDALLRADLGTIAATAALLVRISTFPSLRGSRRLTLGDVRVCENGDETVVSLLTKAAINRFRAYPGLITAQPSHALSFGRARGSLWSQYDRDPSPCVADIETGTSAGCPSFLGGYHVI